MVQKTKFICTNVFNMQINKNRTIYHPIQYLDANGVNAVGQVGNACGGGQRARVVGCDVVTEALL